MSKTQVRILKSHYGERWVLLRHNQKNTEKLLLVQDKFVLKNLLPGDTLCYNCLGEMYQDIIPNLYTIPTKQYTNLVLVNNIEFKYKTPCEINTYVHKLSQNLLLPKGRIIFSISHRYLKYDRVAMSVNSLLKQFLPSNDKFKPVITLNLLGKSSFGYGDYYFCLDYSNA